MNQEDLIARLKAEGVRDDAYALDSPGGGECYVLSQDHPWQWSVYYSERGLRTGEKIFDNLQEAQEEFLRRVLEDPYSRAG